MNEYIVEFINNRLRRQEMKINARTSDEAEKQFRYYYHDEFVKLIEIYEVDTP